MVQQEESWDIIVTSQHTIFSSLAKKSAQLFHSHRV